MNSQIPLGWNHAAMRQFRLWHMGVSDLSAFRPNLLSLCSSLIAGCWMSGASWRQEEILFHCSFLCCVLCQDPSSLEKWLPSAILAVLNEMASHWVAQGWTTSQRVSSLSIQAPFSGMPLCGFLWIDNRMPLVRSAIGAMPSARLLSLSATKPLHDREVH